MFNLLILCQLFEKRASIETDMAKRIMLSVIPALQSETERHHTSGFDYKALKSAVSGINDLLKYGTKACVEELIHYHNKNISYEANATTVKAYFKFALNKWNANDYQGVLELCIELFGEPHWQSQFGGKPWKNIAIQLLKMLTLRNNLSQAKSFDDQFNIMKAIVVEMNVFDGLMHNTANVMEKVVLEEGKSKSQDEFFEDNSWDEVKNNKNIVRQLLNAKEFENPMDVYKQVQDIIERPENKHLFGDWIDRAKKNPSYQKFPDKKELEKEHQKVERRKKTNEMLREVNVAMEMINKTINILNSPVAKEHSIAAIHDIKSLIEGVYIDVEWKMNNFSGEQLFILETTQSYLYDIINKIKNALKEFRDNDIIEATSFLHGAKKLLGKVEELLNQL